METPAHNQGAVTAQSFAELVYHGAYLGGVRSAVRALRNPPGREPDAHLRAMHQWFTQLDADDAAMAEELMRYAGFLVAFGLMGILDGVGGVWNSVERFA